MIGSRTGSKPGIHGMAAAPRAQTLIVVAGQSDAMGRGHNLATLIKTLL